MLNKDFEEARSPSSNVSSQYMTLESRWEQRSWGITTALDTLEEAFILGKIVRDEFQTMKPVAPDTEHLEIGHVDVASCGDDVKIQFDSAGAVVHVKKGLSGKSRNSSSSSIDPTVLKMSRAFLSTA